MPEKNDKGKGKNGYRNTKNNGNRIIGIVRLLVTTS